MLTTYSTHARFRSFVPKASAIPILQDNVTSNFTLTNQCTPQVAILDWDKEEFPPPVQTQLAAGLDVIVYVAYSLRSFIHGLSDVIPLRRSMADVTYNTASFSALVGTLSRLINRKQNGRPPRVLMGYKERDPDERTLWDRAKDIGLCFHQIARVNGAGGNPVEIWLG